MGAARANGFDPEIVCIHLNTVEWSASCDESEDVGLCAALQFISTTSGMA
jgi:hypothetical protein